MGRSKATLPWGTSTMLETVLEPLTAVCARVIVVAHAGQALPTLPADVLRVNDPATLDDQGPLVGTQAGLTALKDTDVVYLSATDKPQLTAEHVAWMFERLGSNDALVPVEPHDSNRRHRMHPLAGALRVGAARPVVDALVAAGERALRRVFEELRAHEVPVAELPNPDVLADYNTPEQYEAVTREQQR